jgi:hypothetical protein
MAGYLKTLSKLFFREFHLPSSFQRTAKRNEKRRCEINRRLSRLLRSGKKIAADQADQALEHSCAGRVVNALTFIVVIICLGLWISFFLIMKDELLPTTLSENLFTNLTCIIFFGGLVSAFFVGALAGNFLRRAFWKLLIRRSRR